jgi:hypothetical protein
METIQKKHGLSLLIGLFLVAVFFGLSQMASKMFITFHPPMNFSSPGEATFWLASALILFPAALLIGYGLSPWLSPLILRIWLRVENMDRRERLALVLAVFMVGLAGARISRSIILLDYPITDDENAVRFGGQVLAMGKLTAPAPEPAEAFPNLFLYVKDGRVTSFDWLGPQLAWAAAEITHTGSLIFALAAALGAVCVLLVVGRSLSTGYGAAAALFFFLSPMAFMLSATSHAHLLSRTWLAATLLFYVMARNRPSFKAWALTGLSFGCGFLCRPLEMSFLLAPLFIDAVISEAKRTRRIPKPFWGLLAGALAPLAVFFLYNHLITGSVFFPARFSAEGPDKVLASGSLWNRFGANTGYNLLMLAVWFLGPLGIILVGLGVTANRFTKMLGFGVLAALLAGCFHDNHGIHVVGPIHYSEAAVPLAVIAAYGLKRLREKLRDLGVSFAVPAAAVVAVLVVNLGIFNAWHGVALNHQAQIQSFVYGYLDGTLDKPGAPDSVVLAPQFARVWLSNPYFRAVGSYVFEWRRAKPDLSDRILIVHDKPGVEEKLRARFPGRGFYRLQATQEVPFLKIEPIAGVR